MKQMSAVAIGLVAIMVVSVAAVGLARHDPNVDRTSAKVGICHATGSAKNPYVFIVVNRNGAEHGHHQQHERDVMDVESEEDCPTTAASPAPGDEDEAPDDEGKDEDDEDAHECPAEEPEPSPTTSPTNTTSQAPTTTPPASNTSSPSPSPTQTPEEEACPGDAAVNKTGEIVGKRLVFNITVSSIGNDEANDVQLTDELPDVGRNWSVSGDDASECTLDGRLLECDFGDLRVNEERHVSVSALRCPQDCGEDIENTAKVSAFNDDNPANDESTAVVEIEDCPEEPTPTPSPSPTPTNTTSPSPTPTNTTSPSPTPTNTTSPTPSPSPSPEPEMGDVGVDKTAEEGVDTVTFTMVVTNHGPDTAVGDGVYLNDSLPEIDSEWFIGGPDSETCLRDGNNLTCQWEEIPANESRTVTATGYTVNVCESEEIVNTARIWSGNDPNPDNNEATASVQGKKKCADVSVTKSAEERADTVVFTIAVSSLGPEDAVNVTLMDELPDVQSDWFLGGPDSEACTLDGRSLMCHWDTLAAGENKTVTATGYTAAVCRSDEIVNTAHVTADQDSDASNNEATATGHGSKVCADATVNKTSSQDDTAVTFTITVEALGPEASRNVALFDALPDVGREWLLGGPDSEACTLEGRNLTCAYGDLAPGATRTVTVKAYTDQMACGQDLVNTARVTSDNDENPDNDEDSATITARPC